METGTISTIPITMPRRCKNSISIAAFGGDSASICKRMYVEKSLHKQDSYLRQNYLDVFFLASAFAFELSVSCFFWDKHSSLSTNLFLHLRIMNTRLLTIFILLSLVACDSKIDLEEETIVTGPSIKAPPSLDDQFCPGNDTLFWTDLDSAQIEQLLVELEIDEDIIKVYRCTDSMNTDKLVLFREKLSSPTLCELPVYAEITTSILNTIVDSVGEDMLLFNDHLGVSVVLMQLVRKYPSYMIEMTKESSQNRSLLILLLVDQFYEAELYPYYFDEENHFINSEKFKDFIESEVQFSTDEEKTYWNDFTSEVDTAYVRRLEAEEQAEEDNENEHKTNTFYWN